MCVCVNQCFCGWLSTGWQKTNLISTLVFEILLLIHHHFLILRHAKSSHLKFLGMSIHKQKMNFVTELLYIPKCAWGRSLSDSSGNWTYSWDIANLSFWSALDKPGHAWLHITEKSEIIYYFHGYRTTFKNSTSCFNLFLRYCWFIILRHFGHVRLFKIPASVYCFYEYLSTQKKIFLLTRMILEILLTHHFKVLSASLCMLHHT